MAELGKRASVAVSYIGKIKTALQMIAITVYFPSARAALKSSIIWVWLCCTYPVP